MGTKNKRPHHDYRLPVAVALQLLGGLVALVLARPAMAQTAEETLRVGRTTAESLVRFLPNATPFDLTAFREPIFEAWANETYVDKKEQSVVKKYPIYVVHQTWGFNDPDLDRQDEALAREQKAKEAQQVQDIEDYRRAHPNDNEAEQIRRAASDKSNQPQLAVLTKRFEELLTQGKVDEAMRVSDQMRALLDKSTPVISSQETTMDETHKKQTDDLSDRKRTLQNRRRQLNVAFWTNASPTRYVFHPKPAGTLAGRPLWREERGQIGDTGLYMLDLGVTIGPGDFEMPKTLINHRILATKSILVWASLQSRADTLRADEAVVRKILESIDYRGLERLIKP